MKNTVIPGDHILVNKMAYGLLNPFTEKHVGRIVTPTRGDVIVFRYPKDPKFKFMQRVIGLDNLLGKATTVFWSVDPESHSIRTDRIGKRIQ